MFGFHAPGHWERIVPIDDCLIASERSNVASRQVLDWCRARGLTAYDRRTHEGFLRNLVVREGRRTGQIQVRLVTMPGALDTDGLAEAVDCDGLLWTAFDGVGETTALGETELIAGSDYLDEEVNGLRFRISPHAFFQTNTEMAEKLYALAGEYAALRGFERVYDLYCGIGTIGLTLAPRASELWGLELIEPAIGDAISNAQLNEIDNARFFAGDVRVALRELVKEAGSPDVVVVDPPRAGLSTKVVRRMIDASPKRIVYVSCNPTTLAPNAAQLVEAGYVLRRVTPVDMFPQTPHIECVALLERGLSSERRRRRTSRRRRARHRCGAPRTVGAEQPHDRGARRSRRSARRSSAPPHSPAATAASSALRVRVPSSVSHLAGKFSRSACQHERRGHPEALRHDG